MTFRCRCFIFIGCAILSWMSYTSFAQKAKGTFVCKDMGASYFNQWTLVNDVKSLRLKPESGNFKLPEKYYVFIVTVSHLNNRLTELRKNGGTLELPVPDATIGGGFDCVTFKVENSGTMSPELNAKYPEIISLKGFALKNKSNTIRYDYNGTAQNISVMWNGVNYLYMPYKSNNKTYYMLFNKLDGNKSIKRTHF